MFCKRNTVRKGYSILTGSHRMGNPGIIFRVSEMDENKGPKLALKEQKIWWFRFVLFRTVSFTSNWFITVVLYALTVVYMCVYMYGINMK